MIFGSGVSGRWKFPTITNEKNLNFAPGSEERELLRVAVDEVLETAPEIPLTINGEAVKTGILREQTNPCDFQHRVCQYHVAREADMDAAIASALEARTEWSNMPYQDRLAIFYKAAHLLSTTYRFEMLACMMVGQGKSARQAEIDGTCELIDFLRFNTKYAMEIYAEQPEDHDKNCWNRMDVRPLEGFVLAIAPFNFTAILGNLAVAPAIMGNTVVLKPPAQNVRAGALIMKILREAGLPPGVINYVYADPDVLTKAIAHPMLAGVHFTGSTRVFKNILRQVGENSAKDIYRSFPRVVGETGGKNFHWIHPSSLETEHDVATVATQAIRGAFEYQGQKCSATSRMYVPRSKWRGARGLRENLVERVNVMLHEPNMVGNTANLSTFMGGVIDQTAYERLESTIEAAKKDKDVEVLVGGRCERTSGWFIYPTVLLVKDINHPLLKQELFGPVLAVYVYDDTTHPWTLDDHEDFLKGIGESSEYALTGAIFAKDRKVLSMATRVLRDACGNFYVNDKSTGAVVGQQAFGGGRMSGTNDKSGSKLNLYRWVSLRASVPRAVVRDLSGLLSWLLVSFILRRSHLFPTLRSRGLPTSHPSLPVTYPPSIVCVYSTPPLFVYVSLLFSSLLSLSLSLSLPIRPHPSIKENFDWPVEDYCYPHQGRDLSAHLENGEAV